MSTSIIPLKLVRVASIGIIVFIFSQCQKQIDKGLTQHEEIATAANQTHGHLQQTKTFPSDVVLKWLDMKYRILLQPQQLQREVVRSLVVRYYGYLGIALYESVVPGMPAYQSLSHQLSGMPQMPATENGKAYHWPASANAALAFIHKNFLPFTSTVNKAAMDSLEKALNKQYQDEVNAANFQRSVAFGREVAKRIIDWSLTDGTFTEWPNYVPPAGPGLWVPTAPNFFAARGVHFGDQRTFMPGVMAAAFPTAPPPYSTDPASEFFKAEKEVYDISQKRTPADSKQAIYWNGSAGGTPAIHWFMILKKLLIQNSTMLDQSALAYCKIGICQYDAAVVAFKSQFTYNMLRPITYIRHVLGYSTWLPFMTPGAPNPDWPDGTITDFSGSAKALSSMFGENFIFNTDGTHHDAAMSKGYTFNSFEEAAEHAATGRFITGVSTEASTNVGIQIGFKTGDYMDNRIKFLKD